MTERFETHLDEYRSGLYNETQLRRDFLDPFWEALGWDIHNRQGFAEAYRDVIHEDAIRVGQATKAPDYGFRIGGMRKFFLEAKKPSVVIKEEAPPAYQLRRYAWSAKLSLSVLSDFEEFAIYDARVKPSPSDAASKARLFYCTFREYAENWDWIQSIFSRDAVLKGSFDRYANTAAKKRGTTTVDDAFLGEIATWREVLSQNLALRNKALTQRHLNFAVQRIIDRIIFLRICEDRGIEQYGRLRSLVESDAIYRTLVTLFKQADDRYNSGLFHFQPEKGRGEEPDKLTPALKVDNKVLGEILRGLYYPDCPYEFSVFSADILGQVYEQFLGKNIRLTGGHRAVVEEKPEVRKAGGVYYTPTYIVDYIIKNAVGELLEGKKPAQVAKIRIVDPACGSGSFLIAAYQHLLNWHQAWYSANEPQKWATARSPVLHQAAGGAWALTLNKRKAILLANIYGVDIDPQAVEVTKLSLLLKVLEGETGSSVDSQLRLFHERALPDLGSNIKCGNSLIGPDFYEHRQMSLLDEDDRYRINVFDWQTEFPAVFKAGGFDAVIGNPPYVRIQGFPVEQIGYLADHYTSANGNFDLYIPFLERGYQLLQPAGRLGMITPNKFLRTDYGEGLRRVLSSNHSVSRIVDFGADQVFDATTYTCLLFLRRRRTERFEVAEVRADREALAGAQFEEHDALSLTERPWTLQDQSSSKLITKLAHNAIRLLDLPADMSRGSSTGNDEVFVFEPESVPVEALSLREPLFASDFGRYHFKPLGKWKVIFPYRRGADGFDLLSEQDLRSTMPRAYRYLVRHQVALKQRKQFKKWYGFSAPRNLELHEQAQIAVPLLADKGLCALIPPTIRGRLCPMASGGFTIGLASGAKVRAEFVLGLLNSRLLFWRLRKMSNIFRGGWITCTKQYFGELPIRVIDFTSNADKAAHDRMVKLVEQIGELHRQLASTRTPQEKSTLERQIAATDSQIDRLVYELYGLSEAEIKLVEGAA